MAKTAADGSTASAMPEEKIPALKRSTVTVIDDRQPSQGAGIQFSNFSLLEDRETHDLELCLTTYGQEPQGHWRKADCFKYTLTFLPARER